MSWIRGIVLPAGLLVTAVLSLAAGASTDDSAPPPAAPSRATVIVGATVLDGTGSHGRRASVRIEGDRIATVGRAAPAPGDEIVDGSGLVLAPGFIDTHSHGDGQIFDIPDALADTSQGITTIVVGQDGSSYAPLERFFRRLERHPAAVNVASYAGHGTIRDKVLGDDFRRHATPAEIDKMQRLLEKEMRAGAVGLSSGLEYDPGIYSAPEEVVALAKTAASFGGRYISHIRSEDRYFWKAIDEIIQIGREAKLPVQISHTKLAMRSNWGQGGRLLARLEQARASGVDITADMYPYLYWESTLTVLFPERDFEDRDAAALVLREISAPDGLLMTQFDPEPSYVGKTLAQIAARRGSDPVTTLIDMIRLSEAARAETGQEVESVIGTSMQEPDVERLMAWHWMNFCTDGYLEGAHPRGFGSYPRILGHYVRQRKVITLADVVRKASGLAAANMGFTDRGLIQPGLRADLVLFDAATVRDRATPTDPHALSEGIRKVWVNGVLVYTGGRATGAHPGRVLRRAY
ncbi:MAG: aminoacylase [Acidobacteria bacterium]|nr:MAG: aminoacylase [Acidobacteriota bacterium]